MRHLTIKTPGQNPKERYRRDIVDYALISLRIALERAPLNELTKLSLSSVHPSAFIYLRHTSGFGCLPSAVRRWRQIRKMHIAVEAWDFYGPSPGLDHLKMIDDFIRSFSGNLEKFTFTWLGRKGPCPLSLAADPLFAPPRNTQKLFHEVTSPMSPLPPTPPRKPVVFRKVRYLAVRNATMNALQVSDLVNSHRQCVREFDFENVVLIDTGNWDEALAPLMDNTSQSEHWTRHSMATISEVGSICPEVLAEDLPTHSAAVAAVSQELLDLDISLFRDEEGETQESEDIDLPSDIEAARKASLLFPNKLKKRRVTKRRRRRKESRQRREEEADMEQHERRHRRDPSEESLNQPAKEHQPLRRFWHKRSKDSVEEPQTSAITNSTPNNSRQPSNESLNRPQEPPRLVIPHQTSQGRLFGEVESIHSSTSSRRLFGEITPGSGSEPELSHSPIDEQEEDSYYFRPQTPQTPTPKARAMPPSPSSSKSTTAKPMMEISAPILDTSPAMPALLQPTVYDPTAELCSEISAVQRDIEAEEAQRLVAEDAEVQISALRRAKELVLSRLAGRDFYCGGGALNPKPSFRRDNGDSPRKESFGAGSFLSSARFREGLFGRSTSVVNMAPVSTDHRSMDTLGPREYVRAAAADGSPAWALVTGASDGIGRALCFELATQGFNVAVHGRNHAKLKRARNELSRTHPARSFRILVLDAFECHNADAVDLEGIVREVVDDIHLAVAINCADAGPRSTFAPLAHYGRQDILDTIHLNAASRRS
ncbi:hypothetical protein DL767_008186 [Monosporascus sp. MG133]|nr:hypothetical protein DL767_008186 [Monosporascus sp. MG133]